MALLQLEEYGFQQTTEPHCSPLKYRVSLRGKVVFTGAAVAGAAVAGAAVAGAAVAGAAVAGAAVAGAAVVAAAPQAVRTMVAVTRSATKTYNCFFIFLLLIKEKLAV
jgi:hypothetical protein